MNQKLFVSSAAGILSATGMAFADVVPPFVLPITSSAVTYRLHENADGPAGVRQRDQHVSLALKGDGYAVVVSSPGQPDETLSLRLDDGSLTASDQAPPDDARSTVEALNFLVALAHHAGPIAAGQTWNTTTAIQLPGGDVVRIPLSVTAKDMQGDDLTLAATGNGAGTVHEKGHSAKAAIDLVLQASFHDGHVVSATTTRKVTAHAMFRTITFTDTWSIAS